jgi:putrescine aminotransferase
MDIKKKYPGFLTVDDAMGLKKNEVYDLQRKYQNHKQMENLMALGTAQLFVDVNDDAGVELIDDEGNIHYDLISNVGAVAVGNANKFVWEQLDKVKKIPALNTMGLRSMSAALANNLALLSPGDLKKVWFGCGGAECVEAAIKLVKMAFKGARTKFVSLEGSYHGKTTGAVALTGRAKWRLYQNPVMPGVTHVKPGDIEQLEEELKFGDVAAFFMEPIQGEGGIHPVPIEYIKAARELCTKYGTLLVCDEIQSGMGRTGKLWAFEHAGIIPDVVTFAKGISGGYMPFGGYICTEEVWNNAYGEDLTCFHHTITYGNNTLGCASGIAAVQFIIENNLMERAAEKGEYMMKKLKETQAKYPEVIKEIRGKGYMIGMEFHIEGTADENEAFAATVAATLMHKYRVQTVFTLNNPIVIRALPPLTITDEQIEYFLKAFENAVKDCAQQAAAATKE